MPRRPNLLKLLSRAKAAAPKIVAFYKRGGVTLLNVRIEKESCLCYNESIVSLYAHTRNPCFYYERREIMKKILSLALVLLMIVALVGCGGRKRKPIQLTLNSEDSAAILAAAGIQLPDPETVVGANTTLKWFSWFDSFHNYNKEEVLATGYWTFQQKYGGDVEYVETVYAERHDKLAALLLSNEAPDFTPCGVSNNAMYPIDCLKGMYQAVDPYIDITDPLWEGVMGGLDYFTLGDQHFALVTHIGYKDVCPYNRRVLDDWGFEDPAELYANDEWTWSKFLDMCLEFNDPDSDRFAVDGYYIASSFAEQSTGHYIIDRDENGNFIANLDDPVIEEGENIVYELARNDCMYRIGNDYWGLNSYGGTPGMRVKDGLCLFWLNSRYGFAKVPEEMAQTYGDMSQNEVMFAPLPRNDNGDGIYYLSAVLDGYSIVRGAQNPEGVALLALCDRFKDVDPTVISVDERQLMEKYYWTEEMMAMNEECNRIAQSNVKTFYTGNLSSGLQSAYDSLDFGIIRTGGKNSWAQLKEQYAENMSYYCDEMNAAMNTYLTTGEYMT